MENRKCANSPPLLEQKNKIKAEFLKKMNNGDTWYIISKQWYVSWQEYVVFDSETEPDPDKLSGHPGPIDNSHLLKDTGEIKERISVGDDVEVIPEESWRYLEKIYGVVEDYDIFKRPVCERTPDKFQVVVCPLRLKFVQKSAPSKAQTVLFSEWQTLGDLKKSMIKMFSLSTDKSYRLLKKTGINTYEPVDEDDKTTLAGAEITDDQTFTLEEDVRNGARDNFNNYRSRNQMGSSLSRYKERGVCGLSNLGNTCFMNSSLQCMSNVPQLTDFFHNKEWEKQVNRKNPLGMQGRMAHAYADLVSVMWSGQCSSAVPRDVKFNVGTFAPQFSGYSQHDSHELLVFLLDGLHEDLNRILKKPYVEFKEAKDRSDEVVAKESWDNHRLRNDSVIVDLFHGLLKSTVECPSCKYVSVTFDPFSSLSLPLPNESVYAQEVFLVRYAKPGTQIKLKLEIVANSPIKSFCHDIAGLVEVDEDSLIVVQVQDSKIYRHFGMGDGVPKPSSIDSDTKLFVYELPRDPTKSRAMQVVFKARGKPFKYPLLIPIEKSGFTARQAMDLLIPHILNDTEMKIPMADTSHTETNSNGSITANQTSSSGPGDLSMYQRLQELLSMSLVEKYYFNNSKVLDITDSKTLHKVESEQVYILIDWKVTDTPLIRTPQITKHATWDREVNKSVDLDNCFRLFTTKEKLGKHDLWYCRVCKAQKAAFKKFDLWTVPDVLIVHLKRFYFRSYFREKINTRIHFPIEGLDVSNWCQNPAGKSCIYDLAAVSNHMGGMGGGHYTAYAKNHTNGKWYQFDDSSASGPIDPRNVITSSAYVLVYTRREGAGTSTPVPMEVDGTS